MRPLALRDTVAGAIAVLAALAIALGAGFVWGRDVARQQALQQQRQQLLDQAVAIQQALGKAQAAGQAVAAQLQQDLAAQHTYNQQLEQRARHAPLVIRTHCAAPAAPTRTDAGLPPAALAVPGHAAQEPASGVPTPAQAGGHVAPPAAGSGVRFTHAAVSLWNSAHAGADVPSGACSPADAASPACAADSGVDEHAAWANQRANAQRWAQCRAQLNALIDAVCGLPGQAPCPPRQAGHTHPH